MQLPLSHYILAVSGRERGTDLVLAGLRQPELDLIKQVKQERSRRLAGAGLVNSSGGGIVFGQ
jgi:hypothetical protein